MIRANGTNAPVNPGEIMLRLLIGLLLAVAALLPAHAAESYDNCTGTIESLPATINTQGTWCLKDNLSTAITSGAAITIATNNVTIDCNDFKVGGLAAGDTTDALGIVAGNRLNATIRNCGIRGFRIGIWMTGASSAGHLIEDNRLDHNTGDGIEVFGSGHVIRRNRIVDTGGRPASGNTSAITSFGAEVVIADNVINGMTVTAVGGDVSAINAFGNMSEVARNTITGLIPDATGSGVGVNMGGATASSIHDNQILAAPAVDGSGISSPAANLCGDNRVSGFASGFSNCTNAGGNTNN
ncbi:MAG TPA: hypothetical protein VGD42_18820 [Lysobacter sp.]